ncbi:recombination mediator RecR [Ignatzschineria cameli]|uniref:Recombination protein RecR n=1 Tax=Ignatzschineria cameli TaxID=2182793 RepID=A0A2U2AKQ9_9GAMM|nr:recombination mediator RecR [Ignatzschineria cameli]PWD83677.1 recombination protein RecR [Ignatzschineria cameli]PWD85613.1 recombination protein RecR [Ignatzschineria cameli]PWD88716.1 recombination protein RecR [Ignatzschineria cameli]PWD89670.1 recombination protein RecR [Ignatzschineria cameli]PWD90560.1 recombination protein RecR [Ignatzschineria cameli]
MYPKSLQDVVDALRILPGVGQKTALRMALYLLERNQNGAKSISRALDYAVNTIQKCSQCRNLTDNDICDDCLDMSRDESLLCVVENPVDVFALRQSIEYKGRYFVLFGRLSPLDGIGPHELGLDLLESRLSEGVIKEIILATNTTVEGEATAHYIAEIAKQYDIAVSRIAHGVPLGGELEYLDGGTLSHAFSARKSY